MPSIEPLPRRPSLPSFRLPSTRGPVAPADYRGRRNLIVLFLAAGCADCRDLLHSVAERYREYGELDAEVLAVLAGGLSQAGAIAADLRLPFPVLADADGAIRAACLGEEDSYHLAVFVADRWGEVYWRRHGGDHAAIDQDELLGWLWFINLQCPECGAPAWQEL